MLHTTDCMIVIYVSYIYTSTYPTHMQQTELLFLELLMYNLNFSGALISVLVLFPLVSYYIIAHSAKPVID